MTAVGYLNVDLDIDSKQDLSAIIAALGENVIVLHHGMVGGAARAPQQCQAAEGCPTVGVPHRAEVTGRPAEPAPDDGCDILV